MKVSGDSRQRDVVALALADAATNVGVDGQSTGASAGGAGGQALLQVWLGGTPAQEDLKTAALGA